MKKHLIIFLFTTFLFVSGCGDSAEDKSGKGDLEETTLHNSDSDKKDDTSVNSLSEKEQVIAYLEGYYEWLSSDFSADMMVNNPVEASRKIGEIHKKAGFKTQSDLEKTLQKYMADPEIYDLTTKIAERSMEIFKNVSK